MIRRTLNNMEKAVQSIKAKGYTDTEANTIAMQCFDDAEQSKNGMSIEWWINKIVDKATWERETREYTEFKNRTAFHEQQL